MCKQKITNTKIKNYLLFFYRSPPWDTNVTWWSAVCWWRKAHKIMTEKMWLNRFGCVYNENKPKWMNAHVNVNSPSHTHPQLNCFCTKAKLYYRAGVLESTYHRSATGITNSTLFLNGNLKVMGFYYRRIQFKKQLKSNTSASGQG